MRTLSKRAGKTLDLPTFQHTSIFRAVSQVLRTDPLFSRACEMFLDWSGTTQDEVDPQYAYCPFCRISPGPMSSAMVTERQHTAPLSVAVELAVQGTDSDNLMNFWGIMVAALWPQNDPVRRDQVMTILQVAGVTRPVISLQGFGYAVDNQTNFMLVSQGSITFNSLLNT